MSPATATVEVGMEGWVLADPHARYLTGIQV